MIEQIEEYQDALQEIKRLHEVLKCREEEAVKEKESLRIEYENEVK